MIGLIGGWLNILKKIVLVVINYRKLQDTNVKLNLCLIGIINLSCN